MVTLDDVRAVARELPLTTEALVHRPGEVPRRSDRVRGVFARRDGGLGFPKDWRALLVESRAADFSLPSQADMRYNWVHVNLAAIDQAEMHELIVDAWLMCVPKRVAEAYDKARKPPRRQRV